MKLIVKYVFMIKVGNTERMDGRTLNIRKVLPTSNQRPENKWNRRY